METIFDKIFKTSLCSLNHTASAKITKAAHHCMKKIRNKLGHVGSAKKYEYYHHWYTKQQQHEAGNHTTALLLWIWSKYSMHLFQFYISIMLISCVHLVMLSSVTTLCDPHGLQPARLLCPCLFSRQEYWSGLPCPSPGDHQNPGIKSRSPTL